MAKLVVFTVALTKPIRRAYEAWVEAGLPLDWDRQAFEAERKMDSKKHLAK